MIEKSTRHTSPRRHRLAAWLALVLVAAGVGGGRAVAQTSAPQTLRQHVEERFDVLTLQDGLALKPKSPVRDVRWVEVTGGTITVNGAPVSGAELRDRLGDDAGVVMQLSYLDPAAQAAMFRGAGSAPAVEPSTPDQSTSRESRSAEGGQFKLGGSITVPVDEIVSGDVVNVGGAIHVLGEVRGDVVAIGGTVELGPAATVGGDVTVIGGSLLRDPAARVGGEVVDVGSGSMESWRARFPHGRWREGWGGRTFGSAVSLLSTLTRVAVLCLLAALVVLVGRDHVARISARAAAEPLKAGAIGLLAQLLLLPLLVVTIVLLVVTIIGIPLLRLDPLYPAGAGRRGARRFHLRGVSRGPSAERARRAAGWGPYATTIAGILILVSPLLLARLLGLAGGVVFPMTLGLLVIGTILEYLAWTIGFGAVALTRFNRPGPATLVPAAPEGPGPHCRVSVNVPTVTGGAQALLMRLKRPSRAEAGAPTTVTAPPNWPVHDGRAGMPPGATVIV